ncbi:MAG: hypothetical protein IPO78_09220 [Saprospiraceae bacterium]|nr:hypothetical protein [Saprospiraceae bacterium]MBK8450070.1 hypothetical protein [Saprospiraceae bacterium]MBK9221288.1 hypothetical protein [Saprospiraceae bacterium]MBK9721777.1 hypothetical protein [Saprospiraceae bacterium]
MEKKDQTAAPFKIIGNWDIQSKQLKKYYSQLTTADLKFEPGKEDELIGRMELRLNKSREDIIKIIRKGLPIRY